MSVPTEAPSTVILVDDAEDLRDLVQMTLERDGRYEVVGVAGEGREGVELAMAHQPDVVLLDISMPLMDGLEALPIIRHVSPSSAVIMFSGFDVTAPKWASRLAEAAGYIEKGFTLRDLPGQISEIMKSFHAY